MPSIARRWKIVTVSVASNALGWLGGAVEVFVVLGLLGTPRRAGTAFVIGTMSLIISARSIPHPVAGRDAGSRQGAHLRPLRAFASQRIRCRFHSASADMIWAGIGLLCLATFRDDDFRPGDPSKSRLRFL